MKKNNLEVVFQMLDEERHYQDTEVAGDDCQKSIGDWLIDIDHYVREAKDQVHYGDKYKAMSQVRKIAALAIAAMEYHETPWRQ